MRNYLREMRREGNKIQRENSIITIFLNGVFPAFPLLLSFSFFTCSSGFWYAENSNPHIRGLVEDDGEWVLFIWFKRSSGQNVR